MTATHANILVFDSGVGGLSIVSHIHRQLPTASITYLADNALFPYGMLEEQALIDRVSQLIEQVSLLNKPDVIVIACNSASTLVLPRLRQHITIPVVGVVPAIKPAARQSKTKVIGLLATPGTIQRDYTDELIGEFAQDCDIIRVGSSSLATLVEQKLSGENPSPSALKQILEPFRAHPQWHKMDTMVLACTHFPLIQEELAMAAAEICYWVDSGEAIARRVKSLLQEAPPSSADQQTSLALFTDASRLNSHLTEYLGEFGFSAIRQFE